MTVVTASGWLISVRCEPPSKIVTCEWARSAMAFSEVGVEAVEEGGTVVVAERPEACHHGVGAGLEEGARDAHHTFTSEDGSGGAAAGGEDDDAPFEREEDAPAALTRLFALPVA